MAATESTTSARNLRELLGLFNTSLFLIAHGTEFAGHSTSSWVIQQLREAFPYDSAPGLLIFDRGSSFNAGMIDAVKSLGIQPKRTSFRSPWQNGVVERWVGNCRRDLLDHVIVLNERHLKRLMNDYIRYWILL